jgi:hypothetical protein
LLYNLIFVAPLVTLFLVLEVTGSRGADIASRARIQLDRWAPRVAPAALVVASAVLLALGAIGLSRD